MFMCKCTCIYAVWTLVVYFITKYGITWYTGMVMVSPYYQRVCRICMDEMDLNITRLKASNLCDSKSL